MKQEPSTPKPARTRSARDARTPLTRERALTAALELADTGGLEALSMRRLADALGVEAMSLYHHVANKDAILDGLVDRVFDEVERPDPALPWKEALRRRMSSLRAALLRHRWALRVLETRTAPGLSTLQSHDAVLGCMHGAGFSIDLQARAFAVLDSYVFGFVHTELSLPFTTPDDAGRVASAMLESAPTEALPHLVRFANQRVFQPDYSFSREFDGGLALILDGIEQQLRTSGAPRPRRS